VCVQVAQRTAEIAAVASESALPILSIATGTGADCRAHRARGVRLTVTLAHWLTSGSTSLARGPNDTPKIVANRLATRAEYVRARERIFGTCALAAN
jgi:hypothetical protein